MALSFTPGASMGGVITGAALADFTSTERAYQSSWVEKLRTAVDFITPANTLICVADAPLYEDVTTLSPFGLAQSFNWSESIAVGMAPEIGSRRKRPIVGSSQGGSIQLSKMLCYGESPARTLTKNSPNLGIGAAGAWVEADWMALVGFNHDKFRAPVGLVVIEATGDGRNYSAFMFEQCLTQGLSRGYQAGQSLVVDNFSLVFEQVRPIFSISAGEVGASGTEI